MNKPKGFADLADLPEDDRIDRIGKYAMIHPDEKVGVVVDDIGRKPDRYAEKITRRFPDLEILKRSAGPVPGTIVLVVKRKPSSLS